VTEPSGGDSSAVCDACGEPTHEKPVHVTMWTDKGLVVIENVPARVCDNCQEQFYDEKIGTEILRLASSGFSRSRMVREITVPVFSLNETDAGTSPAPAEDKKDIG
jgi:YgiT-type zinc finger domain-containing protein